FARSDTIDRSMNEDGGIILVYKPNIFILQVTSSLIVCILFGFAIYLLVSGYNLPGHGFGGDLTTSAAVLLMYMAYGEKVVYKVLPFNFIHFIPLGLLIATLTGLGSFVFNVPFLTQTFGIINFPIIGEVELATAMLFDLGVYF